MGKNPRINKMLECAAAHREHGDGAGARAIENAAYTSVDHAKRTYPNHIAAIENAAAYAEQAQA